jgi:hypothetical protein
MARPPENHEEAKLIVTLLNALTHKSVPSHLLMLDPADASRTNITCNFRLNFSRNVTLAHPDPSITPRMHRAAHLLLLTYSPSILDMTGMLQLLSPPV